MFLRRANSEMKDEAVPKISLCIGKIQCDEVLLNGTGNEYFEGCGMEQNVVMVLSNLPRHHK